MKMNKLYKGILLAVLGLASVPAVQAATYNQDLLVGFTTKSGNDVIVDLGSAASVLAGTAGSGSDTWSLGSSLLTSGGGQYASLGSVYWGVIGDNKTAQTPQRAVFTTVFGGNVVNGSGAWSPIDTAAKSIYTGFTTAGAGQVALVDTTLDNSWNQQTISGSIASQYINVYGNPNTQGVTTLDLYQFLNDGSAGTLAGTFSLASDGVLSFAPVPEPSTYALALLGGVGMLVLSSRKNLRKQA